MKTISLKRYVVLFIGQFFLGGVNVIEVQELQTLQEPELKQSLQTFDHLILNLPDESQSIAELKSFIISFLKTKTKSIILPVNDVMAIIKQKKPNIFAGMKRMYRDNMIIYMITNIDTDYEEAYCRLNKLKQQLGMVKRY